jgi:hypothetical protein
MASLGAVIALIVISIGGLVLLVLGAMMMIGAILPKKSVITSWPTQQEAAFTPFDNRTGASHAKAWGIAIPSGFAVFLLIAGIYFAVAPEKHDIGKTMNMSNLTKKDGAAPAKAPPPKAEEKKVEEKKPEEKKEEKPAEKTDEKKEEKKEEKK